VTLLAKAASLASKWFPTFTLFSVVMRPDVTSCVPNVASSMLVPANQAIMQRIRPSEYPFEISPLGISVQGRANFRLS